MFEVKSKDCLEELIPVVKHWLSNLEDKFKIVFPSYSVQETFFRFILWLPIFFVVSSALEGSGR